MTLVMSEYQLPGFGRFRKVWLTQIHTSWVCGSGEQTAEGFGFTGGIGGFGFEILESRCTFKKSADGMKS